jgi:Cysteine rich repeat
MRFVCRIVVTAALLTVPALAQTTPPGSGKGQLRNACSAEAQKFCANTPRGKGQLRSCLEEHQAELSETCKVAIAAPKG